MRSPMTADRYVVIGVATARADWFRSTSQWATSSALPIEFLRCVSAEEARSRLHSGRPHSALLIDERISGLDRDLIATAKDHGCAVVVVTGKAHTRDWIELGADDAIDASEFDRSGLLEALQRTAESVPDVQPQSALEVAPQKVATWSGAIVAVTGPGGTGTSSIAMAIAQGLGSDPRQHSLVCLADLKLDAELALLHDARDVVPGLQELIDLHRSGVPSRSQVQETCFRVEKRNYDLLLGLRNHRDWTILRRRSTEVAISGLTRSYRHVVADVDLDVEGEDETGSIDVEDRNTLARVTLARADITIVVSEGSMKGLFGLTRAIQRLTSFGIDPSSIVPVINHAPRRVRRRAELVSSFTDLLPTELAETTSSPILVPHKRTVVDATRDVTPLPSTLVKPLTTEVLARLESRAARSGQRSHPADEPVPVTPGSLGTFYEPSNRATP